MERDLKVQLHSISASQGEVLVSSLQVDAKQDNIYQRLYELTNELQAERSKNESISKSLQELSAELEARRNQIERQTSAIAHLSAILAQDTLGAKMENSYESILFKLDTLLARGCV
jgi:predicted  nucleic acid-binding Zn-ribbon protein